MVLKRPFPELTPMLWGEPEHYGRDYWQILPNVYYTGDSAQIDDDGYVWFSGRADEIIKIAGHRIGTIEVETAFLVGPNFTSECILTVDLDMGDSARGKYDFDVVGHYARPDVFRLHVSEEPQPVVVGVTDPMCIDYKE